MMADTYFFDVPVYRCTNKKHSEEMAAEKFGLTKQLADSGFTREQVPNTFSSIENYFDRSLWYPWKYNDIIGWIRVFVCGRQIRGEYWWVLSKRIIKRGKKQFRYCGKAFESEDITSENSNQIFLLICELLTQLAKERPFKGRFIDIELLSAIGPYINWRDLVIDASFPRGIKSKLYIKTYQHWD